MRARVLRDVTGCSDVLCNLERQARGRITGFSRTQKRERIINIVNLAFRVLVCIIKKVINFPTPPFFFLEMIKTSQGPCFLFGSVLHD